MQQFGCQAPKIPKIFFFIEKTSNICCNRQWTTKWIKKWMNEENNSKIHYYMIHWFQYTTITTEVTLQSGCYLFQKNRCLERVFSIEEKWIRELQNRCISIQNNFKYFGLIDIFLTLCKWNFPRRAKILIMWSIYLKPTWTFRTRTIF